MAETHRIQEEAGSKPPTMSTHASKDPGVREFRPSMFDTLQAARDLSKGGFTEPQAEAAIFTLDTIPRNVVTKADLKAFQDELEAEMVAMKAGEIDWKAELAAFERRLTLKLWLMSGFIVGAVALIVKL